MAISPERGRSIFRKTEKELLRLSSVHRSEAVHGFRTTTRRLQTLLGQLVADNERRHKKLLKMLNRIRKSAGKVRDIDVQLEALRSLKVPQEPRRKTQLMQSLLDLRAEHEQRLRKLLKKEHIRDIRKRLKRAATSTHFETGRDPLLIARKMLGNVTWPNGPADEATLHQYRIVVKRARYAVEFAPRTPEATKFLAELKLLQDALGNWRDWLTLTRTAVDRLGDLNESPLVAVLHNITRGKHRQAVAAVTAAKARQGAEKERREQVKTPRIATRKKVAIERPRGAAA